MDYLEFYETISTNNIKDKVEKFLHEIKLGRIELNPDEKQSLVNRYSLFSALNFYVEKNNAQGNVEGKRILNKSVDQLKGMLEELELVKFKILIVIANGSNKENLTSGGEVDSIKKVLERYSKRNFDIEVETHGTYENITSSLQKFQPHILHFIGHSDKEGLFLPNSKNRALNKLRNEHFIEMVKYAGDSLRLIFFNSCASAPLAKDLHRLRNDLYLISFENKIKTKIAEEFSKWFYKILSKNKDFEAAFGLILKNKKVELNIEETNKELMKDEIESIGFFIKGKSKSSKVYPTIKPKTIFDKIKDFFNNFFK